MLDTAKQLIETLNGHAKGELIVLANAVVKTMRDYQENPSATNKKNWDAAKQALAEAVAGHDSKTAAPEGERFKNRVQALNWLHAQGYKVSRGKFYGDVGEGFPQLHRDGSISRYQVMQYGQQLDLATRCTSTGLGLSELEHQAAEAEARHTIARAAREELRLEVEQRELDNRWMLRTDAEEIACAWTSLLRDSLSSRLTRAVPSILHAAGASPERIPEVQQIIDQTISDACNDIATSGEVDVVFEE